MKTSVQSVCRSALLISWISLTPSLVLAELKEFVINSQQSSLTVGGSFFGISFQEQGPGSLTTTFSGTILADVTPGGIEFIGGSVVAAANSGTWEPAPGGSPGDAPANYGAQGDVIFVSGKAAVRNIVLDIHSGVLPVAGESFQAQDLVFAFPNDASSTFDYTYSGLDSGSGSEPLAGNSTNNVGSTATLSAQGSALDLIIPVDFEGFVSASAENDVRITLQGQLIASTGPSESVLEIATLQVSQGRLHFMINATVGQEYTIQSSTNLVTWPTVIDQFTATNATMTRSVPIPQQPAGFFRVQQD